MGYPFAVRARVTSSMVGRSIEATRATTTSAAAPSPPPSPTFCPSTPPTARRTSRPQSCRSPPTCRARWPTPSAPHENRVSALAPTFDAFRRADQHSYTYRPRVRTIASSATESWPNRRMRARGCRSPIRSSAPTYGSTSTGTPSTGTCGPVARTGCPPRAHRGHRRWVGPVHVPCRGDLRGQHRHVLDDLEDGRHGGLTPPSTSRIQARRAVLGEDLDSLAGRVGEDLRMR